VSAATVGAEMPPDSEMIDRVIKKAEYAAAGVPRYWVVDRDKGNSVQTHRLTGGAYELDREPQSLAWLTNEPVPALD
jgi:Uma2 family endonuclease